MPRLGLTLQDDVLGLEEKAETMLQALRPTSAAMAKVLKRKDLRFLEEMAWQQGAPLAAVILGGMHRRADKDAVEEPVTEDNSATVLQADAMSVSEPADGPVLSSAQRILEHRDAEGSAALSPKTDSNNRRKKKAAVAAETVDVEEKLQRKPEQVLQETPLMR